MCVVLWCSLYAIYVVIHAGVILYIWDGGAITYHVCGVGDIDVVR